MALIDPKSWLFTSKVIRIAHNREVKKYFSDVKSNSVNNGRSAIRNALLINPGDSALEILNKQIYFRLGLSGNKLDPVLALPESWNLKPGNSIPQLVIVYRTVKSSRTGNYSVHIPHYNGDRTPTAPAYTKGEYGVLMVLKDGSKLLVNANSENEGKQVVTQLSRLVKRSFVTDDIRITMRRKVKNTLVRPHYADFYPNGKDNTSPEWRYYFPS